MHYSKKLKWILCVFVICIGTVTQMSGVAQAKDENYNYYRGTRHGRNTAAIRHSEKQNIPKKYRGTYYAWNFLRNRKERIIVKKRDFRYSHKNAHGKWVYYQRFYANYLAVSKLKNGQLKLQSLDRRTKHKIYYMADYAVLTKKKKAISLQIKPYRKNFFGHRKVMTFKKKAKKIKTRPRTITKQWFAGHKFTTCYYMYKDSKYNLKFSKTGKRTTFGIINYWDSDMSTNPIYMLALGTNSFVDLIVNKNDKTKATLIFNDSLEKNPLNDKYANYYSYYVQRISKNYLQGLKGGIKRYKGHPVDQIDALKNKRVIREK